MKRSFNLAVLLNPKLLHGGRTPSTHTAPQILASMLSCILAWAIIGCTSRVQSPTPGGSAIPKATSTMPLPTASAVIAYPTAGTSETAIFFEALAQGYRLSSGQAKPALLLATDPLSREAIESIIATEHQDLLRHLELDKKAILAATWGVKPSGGFSITICNISTTETNLIVNVILKENDPNVPRVEASTFPYHLVAINRLDLPREGNLHYRLMNDNSVLAEGEFELP